MWAATTVLGLLVAIIGWIGRTAHARIDRGEKKLAEHGETLAALKAEQQSRDGESRRQFEEIKDVLKEMRTEIREDLNRMWAQINKKT